MPHPFEPVAEPERMRERLKELICAHLNLDAAELNDDTHFRNDLGVCSMDLVSLLVAVEKEFQPELGAAIPPGEALKLLSLRQVAEYIEARMQNTGRQNVTPERS